MSVNGSISSCSRKVFIVLVRNVSTISGLILFRQSKINHENHIGLLLFPNQEIIRLNVSMQKTLVMNVLDPLKYLQTNHYCCFYGKRFSILLEQRLQWVAQWFHDHNIFLPLCKIFVDLSQNNYVPWVCLDHWLFRLHPEAEEFWLRSRAGDF